MTNDGKPIRGAYIVGSLGKTCCPFQLPHTETDESGHFKLENPGAVVRIYAGGYEPHAEILKSSSGDLNITMSASTNDLVAGVCHRPGKSERLIGGSYGFGFTIPTKDVRILGGKPDVDYVRFVIQSKADGGVMEIWLGPYAFHSDPHDDLLTNSTTFMMRNIVWAERGAIGADSHGNLKNGRAWRWTGGAGDGADYTDASADDQVIFDRVIDTICYTPYTSSTVR